MLLTTLLLSLCVNGVITSDSRADGYHDQDYIDNINSKQTLWKAQLNERFASPEARKAVVGVTSVSQLPPNPHIDKDDTEIPESFDARTRWPECESVIGHIRDQSTCADCWAVSISSVISDRTCIASNGSIAVPLSSADIAECCTNCFIAGPCKGGDPVRALNWWKTNGVVTGGDHNSRVGCKPNPLPGSPDNSQLLRCDKYCLPGYNNTYQNDKHYGLSVYYTGGNEAVQREIMANGPVAVTITAYDEFFHYRSGVLFCQAKRYPNHVVKILGWGVENGTDYWLVANSWGSGWGDHGFLKIRRGFNDCSVEKAVISGLPRL